MGQFRRDYWRIDTGSGVVLHLARASFEEGFRLVYPNPVCFLFRIADVNASTGA